MQINCDNLSPALNFLPNLFRQFRLDEQFFILYLLSADIWLLKITHLLAITGNNKKNNVLNFTLSIRFDYFNLYIWYSMDACCHCSRYACLLICINDNQFMEKFPQKGWSNCILIVCVIITLFLTASTFSQSAFGWTVTMQYTTISTLHLCNVIISGLCTIFTMYML